MSETIFEILELKNKVYKNNKRKQIKIITFY